MYICKGFNIYKAPSHTTAQITVGAVSRTLHATIQDQRASRWHSSCGVLSLLPALAFFPDTVAWPSKLDQNGSSVRATSLFFSGEVHLDSFMRCIPEPPFQSRRPEVTHNAALAGLVGRWQQAGSLLRRMAHALLQKTAI